MHAGDTTLLVIGLAIAIFMGMAGMWTRENRTKERKMSLWTHYVWVSLIGLCVLWATSNLSSSTLAIDYGLHSFYLILGYLAVYPITFLRNLFLKRTMRSF